MSHGIAVENHTSGAERPAPQSATGCPCCWNDESNRRLYRLRYGEVRQCGRCQIAYTVFDAVDVGSANEVFGSRDYVKSRIYELYNLRRTARARLVRLRAYASTGDLLEFGASTGEFLYESHLSGFRVSCVDRYPALLDANRPQNVVEVFQQDADAFAIGKTFDVVAAFHVLEHLRHPEAFLRKCRDLLTPEGVLFLEVPNFDALARRIWRGRWGMFYDYHLCHFGQHTLVSLLEHCGYCVLETRTVDDPLRYLAPFYQPVRNALWSAVKRLRRGSVATPAESRKESEISASAKAWVYRLESGVLHALSLLLLPLSLPLGWVGIGSYLQVIARKAP